MLLAYPAINIIWLYLMITPILCELFLCALNLTPFPLCQKIAYVFTQFGRTIKAVQCDNGREFNNVSSRTFFTTKGVLLRMSCPYTSPQNGKIERILHTINNMLRSLLFQTSIPAHYWVEGHHTTTYRLNRLPTKATSTTNPYFTLHGVAPSYEHLRAFDCVCYPNLSAKAAHKLAPGPPDVFSSNTSLTTKVTGVLISPPTTVSTLDTLFLMRKIFPSLSRPI
jgi:hypothetical protein